MRSLFRLSMTLLTSYLGRILIIVGLLFFAGCATERERPVSIDSRYSVAVLPLENLSGRYAPLKEIREAMINKLREYNFSVLDEEKLERFMARHRVRYVGGLDYETASAFKKETGVDGIIISSLEFYSEANPLKISINCRMLSTEERPSIVWMDSVGISGNDSPGLLGLGIINSKEKLMDKAFTYLFDSLLLRLSGEASYEKPASRYEPKMHYFAPNGYCPEGRCTVAVVPFFNISDRKNAGDIMALHLVKELLKEKNFNVIEPGEVRQKLLSMRVIMNDGISVSDVYFLSNALNADLVFSGRVLDYRDQEGTGVPKIDFSVQAVYGKEKKLVWSSKSFNKGDDGVLMFDIGRLSTANKLATYMARNVVSSFVKENLGGGGSDKEIVEKNGKRRLWGFYQK